MTFGSPALACVMIRSEYRNCTIKQKISEYQSKKKTGDNPGRKLGIKYRNFGAYTYRVTDINQHLSKYYEG
jgi:hypothetical protein